MIRQRVLGALALAVAVVALPATAAGASSSQSTSAKQWANGVCSALQDFGTSVRSTLDGLKSAGSLDEAAQQAGQGIQQAADDLQTSLQDLGKPPTSGAKQAQSAIKDLSKQLSADVDDAKAALQPPPSTPQEIASAFAEIGTIVQKGVGQTQSTLNTLQSTKSSKPLQSAFQSASSCKQLQQSSS
ncbi:MAG TPA: hypothetical protein VH986_01835 [Acidimicrobiia bacterium]